MFQRLAIVMTLLSGLSVPAAAQTVLDMPPPPPATPTGTAADDADAVDLGALALARYARSSGPRSYTGPSTNRRTSYYGRSYGYYGPYGYNGYYGYPYYGFPYCNTGVSQAPIEFGSRGFTPARDNPLHANHYGLRRHQLNRLRGK